MASSQLYREARSRFVQDAEARYKDAKDLDMLRDFLAQNGRPEDAQVAAGALKQKAGEKWGSKKIGDAEIPAVWIDTLMANIGNFVAVGNYAMTGAPESVGLAWFAVKLTLSAIQSNYELYTFFGSALTDISEIMIIIPHYDRLYDERTKPNSKGGWKPSPVVEKLFQDIIHAYAAVLNFSFSIRRHLGAGALAKLRHGFKDFFGASKGKFEGKMATIASFKKKILEDSQAIFQDKSLHQIDAVKGIVSNIEGTVNEIRDFQSTLQKMHEEQVAQWAIVLKSMEEIKSTTKPKTPWDIAIQKFERNKDALSPQKNTTDALGDAIDRRHPGTCEWIFKCSDFSEWKKSPVDCMLCISGQQDSGKSTVLATIVERLDLENDGQTALLYLNCGSSRGGAAAKKCTVDTVCNTLLYLLYEWARHDEDNLKLLEDCNKVFEAPREKEKARDKNTTKSGKTEILPEFVDAFLAIASHLNMNVIVALDEADGLENKDQQELAVKVGDILTASKAARSQSRFVKFLVGCRSASKFYSQSQNVKSLLQSIDVGDFNDDDMEKQLADALKEIPGLTPAEQKEATDAILKRAGPQFAYIGTIAIPFMREPFQRPLSRRLQSLPEGMESVYSDALRKMGSNYIELLRTALLWSLLAPIPLLDHEIMDAYHGTYDQRGPEVEEEARAIVDGSFPTCSKLEIEQLQDARGPFLRLELLPITERHLVYLEDPPQVRDFCLGPHEAHAQDVSNDAHFCTRCKAETSVTTTLNISLKEGHLQLALSCMRAMNNPVFQRRATKDDKRPLWSRRALTFELLESEPPVKRDDSVIPDASIDEETMGSKSRPEDVEGDEQLECNADDAEHVVPVEDANTANLSEKGSHVEDSNQEDPDDSQDDEDRGELNLSNITVPINDNDEDFTYFDGIRTFRYEQAYWHYHIRQAEALWSPEERSESSVWAELFSELDHWVTKNPGWFKQWQLWEGTLGRHDGRLKPLHVAAYLGLTSWVSHLLKNGADINEVPYGASETPLQVAADQENTLEMLQLLLENGADPNTAVNETTPAFQKWMIRRSDLADIELLLKHGADLTVIDQSDSWTALHCFAAKGEDTNVLELLLNHESNGVKPDINARDERGNVPLHVLLWRGEVPKALLQAFLDNGADVNEENIYSARPLQMACLYGDLETLETLCQSKAITEVDDEDDDGDTALMQAAICNHTNCVEFLVKFGADANVQNHNGRAALHDVAWHGSKECVKILLDHGAKPNILDKHNRTPLFFACLDVAAEEKAEFLLDALLENKVPLSEINALTKRGRTPLREAAAHGFERVVEKLIRAAESANECSSLAINVQDSRKEMTPLHRAAWLGKSGCVRLLLAANADVALRDKDKKTALMLAYEQWTLASHQGAFEDIVSLLIDKDPKAAVADPELAAICAVNGSTRLLQQISALGADLSRQDQYGWTPIELARHHRQSDASHFLKQQAAWAGMLPSRWAKDSRTQISDDGLTVTHTNGERVCLSTNKPLPPGLDNFYFEITSKPTTDAFEDPESDDEGDKNETYPILALGFCTIGGSAILFPGWPPRSAAPSARSWGYHGDDGNLFNSREGEGMPVAREMPYRAGQTIGCGVDLTTQTMWFTLEGEKLESGFANVQGRLFPLLGLRDGVVVEANFTGPFLWKDGRKGEEKGEGEEGKVIKQPQA